MPFVLPAEAVTSVDEGVLVQDPLSALRVTWHFDDLCDPEISDLVSVRNGLEPVQAAEDTDTFPVLETDFRGQGSDGFPAINGHHGILLPPYWAAFTAIGLAASKAPHSAHAATAETLGQMSSGIRHSVQESVVKL